MATALRTPGGNRRPSSKRQNKSVRFGYYLAAEPLASIALDSTFLPPKGRIGKMAPADSLTFTAVGCLRDR